MGESYWRRIARVDAATLVSRGFGTIPVTHRANRNAYNMESTSEISPCYIGNGCGLFLVGAFINLGFESAAAIKLHMAITKRGNL